MACAIRARARPNCGADAVAAIAVYYGCDVSLRPKSCESRVAPSNKLCVDAIVYASTSSSRQRGRPKLQKNPGSPPRTARRPENANDSKVRGRAPLKTSALGPRKTRQTRRRAAARHVLRDHGFHARECGTNRAEFGPAPTGTNGRRRRRLPTRGRGAPRPRHARPRRGGPALHDAVERRSS